jgi:hypothetical protein
VNMKTPKRYIVFGFDQYYPSGGFRDAIQWTDDYEEAVQIVRDSRADYTMDFYEIVDLVEPVIKQFDFRRGHEKEELTPLW